MSSIESSITMRVFPDPNYHYEVHVMSDEVFMQYVEDKSNVKKAIYFASADEMKAVANAMLVAAGVMK